MYILRHRYNHEDGVRNKTAVLIHIDNGISAGNEDRDKLRACLEMLGFEDDMIIGVYDDIDVIKVNVEK